MNIRRVMRCFVTLAVLAWCGGAWATNLLYLKDTLTVLPESLRKLSLLHGAVAWHSGAIMNMYDYGVPESEPLIPRVKNEDETEADFVIRKNKMNAAFKKWESSIESPIIKNIVRKLFYRVPGTTSSADFKVASNEIRAFNKNNQLYIKNTAQRLVQLLYREIIEPHIIERKDGKSKDILGNYNESLKSVLLLPKNIENIEDDCFFGSSQDQIRAEIVIRLAQLWALIGHDRNLIKNYYEDLKSTLAKVNLILAKALVIIGFDKVDKVPKYLLSWDGDITFDPNGFKNIASLKSYLLQPNASGDNSVKIHEAASCLLLFKELTPVSSVRVHYKDGEYDYANCADTVVRNIINYMSLNKNGEFDISVIEGMLGDGHRVHESLRQFYAAHHVPLKQDEPVVHRAWETVVSNLEFVEYAQAVTGCKLLSRRIEKGFIKIADGVDPQRFIAEGFKVVDSKAECFEVRSTAHNLIIILNHILQLNLFNNETLRQEYFKQEFVETFLPKVFEKIGTVDFVLNDSRYVTFSLNLDDLSLSKLGHAYATLHITFNIRHHGEFSVDATGQDDGGSIKELQQKQGNVFSLAFLSIIPVDKWFEFFPEINESFVLHLWPHVRAENFVRNILDQDNLYTRGINLQEYTLLKKIVTFHADKNMKSSYLKILDLLWILKNKDFAKALVAAQEMVLGKDNIESSAGIKIFKALFTQEDFKQQAFEKAFYTAHLALHTHDYWVYVSGIHLFTALVSQEGIEKPVLAAAFFVAHRAVYSEDRLLQGYGVNLFKALLGIDSFKGQTLKGVFDVAQSAVLSNNKGTRISGIQLFVALLGQKEVGENVLAGAFEAAKIAGKSDDRFEQRLGIELFEVLVGQESVGEQVVKGALEVAECALGTYVSDIQKLGITLLNALLEKKDVGIPVFEVALKAAQIAVESYDSDIQVSGITLFKVLFSKESFKEQAFKGALKAAQNALESYDRDVQVSGITLFKVLLKQDATKAQAISMIKQLRSNIELHSETKANLNTLLLQEEMTSNEGDVQ